MGSWLRMEIWPWRLTVEFLTVVEHRLILARVRSEWTRLKCKGLASISAPACQDSSHVGNAGVGVVSLRGTPVALPTFATAQFTWFFECGRAIRCLLPLGGGRFMPLVVLCGYQGADSEQLALTDQLFDAALSDLGVVARGQQCMLVGDFNVERTKIPCLAKGISAGLWVDLEASAGGMQPAATCKRTWEYAGGHRGDSCCCCLFFLARLSQTGGLLLILLSGLMLRVLGGLVGLISWSSVLPSGLLLGCLLLLRAGFQVGGGTKSLGVYDDRLQFMTGHDALLLDESLRVGDVSRAWRVWSGAAETALDDAYRFAGSPIPTRGLVLGRGSALFQCCQAWSTWFGRLAVILLMLTMLLMSLCIGAILLLPCLI